MNGRRHTPQARALRDELRALARRNRGHPWPPDELRRAARDGRDCDGQRFYILTGGKIADGRTGKDV